MMADNEQATDAERPYYLGRLADQLTATGLLARLTEGSVPLLRVEDRDQSLRCSTVFVQRCPDDGALRFSTMSADRRARIDNSAAAARVRVAALVAESAR